MGRFDAFSIAATCREVVVDVWWMKRGAEEVGVGEEKGKVEGRGRNGGEEANRPGP
jgi:hypothetical protein